METLLMSMLADPQFVHDLLDRITDYNIAVIDNVCKWNIDAILFGDDWGDYRQGLLDVKKWHTSPHLSIRVV